MSGKTVEALTKRIHEAALDSDCRTCGATPGEPCTTKSGKPARMHSRRLGDSVARGLRMAHDEKPSHD